VLAALIWPELRRPRDLSAHAHPTPSPAAADD
jgi:hypothetical protein